MIPHEQLDEIAAKDDFITHDTLMSSIEGHHGVMYSKRDFLLRGGYWRGARQRSVLAKSIVNPIRTLVSGHSDYAFSRATWWPLKLAGVGRVLVSNLTVVDDRLRALPLGLTNDCDDSPQHRILGDRDQIRLVIDEQYDRGIFEGSIFSSFNLKAHPSRVDLHAQLSGMRNLVNFELDYSSHGRLLYLRTLRKSNFVLCPRGNGIDTHRLWETLYVGGFPIVKRFPHAEDLLEGLPVVIVDSWTEVMDVTKLEEHWFRLTNETHSAKRLSLAHLNQIALSENLGTRS